jgi:hypothetical protein
LFEEVNRTAYLKTSISKKHVQGNLSQLELDQWKWHCSSEQIARVDRQTIGEIDIVKLGVVPAQDRTEVERGEKMTQMLFALGSAVLLSAVLIGTPARGQGTPNPVTVKNTELDAAKLSKNPEQNQGVPTLGSTPDQTGKQEGRHDADEPGGNKSVPSTQPDSRRGAVV